LRPNSITGHSALRKRASDVPPLVDSSGALPVSSSPGPFSRLVADAIEDETGSAPELSTSGGTSDARFLKALCPVIELGLNNATMHKRDEAVALADLEALARIYRRIAQAALAG
jgi:succinyl-diaminopimelate desuccinylase